MELNFEKINEVLLHSKKPSEYFNYLLKEGKLNSYPYLELKKLKDIEQSKIHHPEGSVWNHVMLVLDNGAYYRDYANDKSAFMWALLMHDIGKISTTKIRKGRWTSYNHDNVGAIESMKFMRDVGIKDEEFLKTVSNLVKYHMHFLYIQKKLPFGNRDMMLKEVDINDITLVFLCDRLGRGSLEKEDKIEIIASIHEFLDKYKDLGYGKLNFIR
ncbi:MAG: HD domain-containing protein [Clostridium sp.]|uniref:HD domain-containing protein n=1 Tax=Clostridium sp. TaxID=1506 RepID=UPI002FC5D01B